MDIEAIVKKFAGGLLGVTYRSAENVLRAALTEAESCMAMEHNLKMLQVEANHAIELRAYEATVANLEERIREMAAERVPEDILEIGRRMIADTKDNFHYTAHPMFRVEKRRIVTGIDLDFTDSIAWIDEDGEILDPEEAATLEAAYDKTGEVPDSYTRTGFVEEWEHVDTYLTQQAAEARINGGKDGRVNVGSAYRNSEMRAVREFLMSLAAPQPKKEGE